MDDPTIDASLERRFTYHRHIVATGKQAEEIQLCAADIAHWINHWCLTYDPRRSPATIPFDLWPRQVQFLDWLAERERRQENGVAEKSRDVGLTYLTCAYCLHGWLFRPGFAAGFGSRKLELVDRLGDPDSIFEKLRIMLYGLPPWMLPAGFARDRHDNQARLVNPETDATLTGEGGDQIGRGARKSLYIVDEAAFLEHAEKIERALSQTTNCRIDISTPAGLGNPFARKRFSGTVPVFSFRYSDDPRKGPEWLAEQRRKFDSVTVAQEVLLDYSASVEGVCIPAAWVRAAVELALSPSGQRVAGLDVAEYGSDRCVLLDRRGPVVGEISDWGQCNTTETAYRARDECQRRGVAVLAVDVIGVGAGVRGTYETAGSPLPFEFLAVNVGSAPTETYWPDGKTSKERFVNLRAELWWKMRARFEKCYERVEQGIAHPDEDCISIPNHPQLIAELSLPLAQRVETGKLKLEAKDKMRKRGVRSPNFADALALTMACDDAADPFWDAGAKKPKSSSLVAQLPADVFLPEPKDEWDEPLEGEGIWDRE